MARFGREFDPSPNQEPLFVYRLNQKGIWSGDGAALSSLDYTTSLVSRYAFGSNGNDSIGSNNLTANGSPTYNDARYGLGAVLNGSSMYYTASSNSIHNQTTGNFAITGWFKLAATGSKQILVCKRDDAAGANAGYLVGVTSGNKLYAEYSAGSLITATGTTTLNTTRWYYFAAVYNRSGSLELYLGTDIAPAITLENSIAINATTITNTVTFAVGRMNGATPNGYFNGTVDQIQIFSSTITSANLLQIMTRLHSSQLAACEETGSGFTINTTYQRNAENTAWEKLVKLSDLTGVAVSINLDNTGGSAACTGTQVTAASYVLAANTYTTIIVVATGNWAGVARLNDNAASFDVTIDIGGTAKTITHDPFQDLDSSPSDNSAGWNWTHQFSAALQAGGTIALKGDHDGTVSRTITCTTLYVYGVLSGT